MEGADIRLGWTGDLQAFAPTASFLYDTSGFLANWLHDLSEEQLKDSDGVVPLVVPDTLSAFGGGPIAQAVWVRTDSRPIIRLTMSGGCRSHHSKRFVPSLRIYHDSRGDVDEYHYLA